MEVGIFPVGTGVSADPGVLGELAQAADAGGVSTLWSAGHPFRVNALERPYPYAASGVVPVPPTADSYEQFVTLAFLAAITQRVRLGTGVLVSPLLHPLELAKLVASVDDLCRGRFILGVGVGWMKEEFDVLGEPWRDRARRTIAGLEVAKRIWSQDVTTLESDDWSFPEVMSYPKPVQRPHPPIYFGGTSEHALRRVARHGEGWFAFCSSPEELAAGRARIEEYARAEGRRLTLRVTVAPGFRDLSLDDLKRYRDAGADEVAVGAHHGEGGDVTGSILRIIDELVGPAATL
jgi:probable F420-dependent oxidoreductase